MPERATILASSLPAQPSFAENLQYQITGLLVVLTTLAGLALVVWLAGRFFSARDRHQAGSAATPAAPAVPAIEGTPGPVFAVIAAAVQTALEDEHFIIHGIRAEDPRSGLAWSAEGRRSIYASKNLR